MAGHDQPRWLIPPIKSKLSDRARLPVFHLVSLCTVQLGKVSRLDASREIIRRRNRNVWKQFRDSFRNRSGITKTQYAHIQRKRFCKRNDWVRGMTEHSEGIAVTCQLRSVEIRGHSSLGQAQHIESKWCRRGMNNMLEVGERKFRNRLMQKKACDAHSNNHGITDRKLNGSPPL